MNFSNLKNQTVFAKTAELKRNPIEYYGIGTNNQVLDYAANTPIQARCYFEMEFASMGEELSVMNAYQR
ncbi:hypothetical protein [Brevibacillus sp. NRS-1366]|uniref:hypothetical protein n=1 Tax=Brevibacillus sp. NRS-1366 TaxID=3233899 RepID=UPI003D1DCCAB